AAGRVRSRARGGRGRPPIADDLARLVERFPDAQLIVAHAGIADLAAFADRLGGKAGVFFDTSVWSPLDLLGPYRLPRPRPRGSSSPLSLPPPPFSAWGAGAGPLRPRLSLRPAPRVAPHRRAHGASRAAQ